MFYRLKKQIKTIKISFTKKTSKTKFFSDKKINYNNTLITINM